MSEPYMRFGRDVAGLDLYGILGVTPRATAQEIQRAYRRQVRESHPDLHPDNPAFARRTRELNLAARVLLEPSLRAAYDRLRAAPHDVTPKSWWERASNGPCEWIEPDVPSRAEPAPVGFMEELRGRAARAFSRFDGFLLALPPRGRLLVGSVGVGLALLLLAAARPRVGSDQPVSISPAVLSP